MFSRSTLTFWFFSICIVIAFLGLFDFETQRQNNDWRYEQAQLEFSSEKNDLFDKSAVMEGPGKFLFAADATLSAQTGLLFNKTADLMFIVNAAYPATSCSAKGLNKASVSITSQSVTKTQTLVSEMQSHSWQVKANEVASIHVTNASEPGCGRLRLRLQEVNHVVRHLGVWACVWLVLVFLGFRNRVMPVAVLGAAAHATLLASELTLGALVSDVALISGLVSLTFGALCLVLLASLKTKWLMPWFALLAFATIAAIFGFNLVHHFLYGVPLQQDSLLALFQTNFSESAEFVFDLPKGLILGFLVVGLLLAAVSYKTLRSCKHNSRSVWFIFAAIVFGFMATRGLGNLSTVKLWQSSLAKYQTEYAVFAKLIDQRKGHKTINGLVSSRSENSDVTVVVIGESQNKQHMGMYGYPRQTTPHLSRRVDNGELVVLSNAYSNHTHTVPSLSLALTNADQHGGSWMNEPSLLSLAKEADIATYWISNQQMLGVWDNKVALLASEADSVQSINKKVGIYKQPDLYDGALLPYLQKALVETPREKKLIVLHLMGNHGSYCKRYPKAESLYSEIPEIKDFGRQSLRSINWQQINCYDNSIVYNDKVMDQIIELLETQKAPVSLFYFSDHAEDVVDSKGHNQAKFTYAMTHIPAYFWANTDWKQQQANIWQNLTRHKDRVFTNDHVFETVAGLLGVHAKSINTSHDLTNGRYAVEKPLVTLHGRKSLTDSSHRLYWQKRNAAYLKEQSLDQIFLPHRVNTLGKLKQVLNEGVLGYEVDIVFNAKANRFDVGHGSKALTGVPLNDFLSATPKTTRVWLDLKNLTDSNAAEVVSRLEFLDKSHAIKSRVIVESSLKTAAFKQVSQAGFHSSYYLPTKTTIDTMKSGAEAQAQLAETLNNSINTQALHAVSFDWRLYPFVKTYLQPLLKKKLDYHSRLPGFGYPSSGLETQLETFAGLKDKRLKTVLLPYSSAYSFN